MIAVDHIAVPVRDVTASAAFLAEILAVAPASACGPEGEMRWLAIGASTALLFSPAEQPVGLHIAFRVDAVTFAEIVARLRARGIAFGNDPESPANGETMDLFGGHGRVYFADPNGHFFEV